MNVGKHGLTDLEAYAQSERAKERVEREGEAKQESERRRSGICNHVFVNT